MMKQQHKSPHQSGSKDKPSVELALSSDHSAVNGQRDSELVLAIEVAPSRSLRGVARRRSARPHVMYALDVSGSMTVVTDDPDELVDVGRHVIDGSEYRIVERRDGAELSTLMGEMFSTAEASLAELKPEDQISVMHFSSELSQPQSFSAQQRAEVTRAIHKGESLKHQETNMSGALAQVRAQLSAERSRPKCAVLFTDGMPDQGTERRVIDEARRCAQAGIPVHVCAFGDQLSHDFLSEISAVSGGQVHIGRDQDTLLRQFSSMIRDAQQAGLIDLCLELSFDERFLPAEVFRGKPQNQLIMRCKPGTRRLTLPLGNLNAGSWQSIYVKGRLLGSGEISGAQPVASVQLSYRSPDEAQTRSVSARYAVPLAERSRRDRQIQELVEITLLKSTEKDFNEAVNRGDQPEMMRLALELHHAYEALESPEGQQGAENYRQVVKALSDRGVLDAEELQRLINQSSEASTTSAQSERFGVGSSTNVSRVSDTSFAGDGEETNLGSSQADLSIRRAHSPQGARKPRREVLEFDI